MSPRDMEFPLMRYKILVKGAIRLNIIFFGLNALFEGKEQAKVIYCMKLALLISRCPEETHTTNFTRMPHLLFLFSACQMFNILCESYQDSMTYLPTCYNLHCGTDAQNGNSRKYENHIPTNGNNQQIYMLTNDHQVLLIFR